MSQEDRYQHISFDILVYPPNAGDTRLVLFNELNEERIVDRGRANTTVTHFATGNKSSTRVTDVYVNRERFAPEESTTYKQRTSPFVNARGARQYWYH